MSNTAGGGREVDPEHHPTHFPLKEAMVILAAMVISAIVTVTIAFQMVSTADLIPRSTFETERHNRVEPLPVPVVKTKPAGERKPVKASPTLAPDASVDDE